MNDKFNVTLTEFKELLKNTSIFKMEFDNDSIIIYDNGLNIITTIDTLNKKEFNMYKFLYLESVKNKEEEYIHKKLYSRRNNRITMEFIDYIFSDKLLFNELDKIEINSTEFVFIDNGIKIIYKDDSDARIYKVKNIGVGKEQRTLYEKEHKESIIPSLTISFYFKKRTLYYSVAEQEVHFQKYIKEKITSNFFNKKEIEKKDILFINYGIFHSEKIKSYKNINFKVKNQKEIINSVLNKVNKNISLKREEPKYSQRKIFDNKNFSLIEENNIGHYVRINDDIV